MFVMMNWPHPGEEYRKTSFTSFSTIYRRTLTIAKLTGQTIDDTIVVEVLSRMID